MTQEELKQLEKELWDAADDLRANSKLTAAEYKDPLLGLVLLRFAQNRYEQAIEQVEAALPINPRTGKRREPNKDDFRAAGAIMLPGTSKYDYLADLPEDQDIAEAVNTAMKGIEAEYKDLDGVLPKNYQELDEKLLRQIIRVFNKDAVKKAKGDVFGRIYEYFLMKFSMQGAGAQEGGEFFTPPALVDLIVHFIEPNQGKVHDPACGSGGMFVQTAHFIQQQGNRSVNKAITVYGTEYKTNNSRLAKMNLAIHGLEGNIVNDNSFYSDPHGLVGQCDFVMANPPFNVDKVDPKNKFLTEDKRLPFKAPLTGKGTIGNANYLWIQYFYSYLNAQGRAGFVMASSATDAGHAEKRIREQLVETGDVDCIVSIGNNFFYTRSLPCHLWFFDKNKAPQNHDKILMIDARNIYRVVNSTVNDFSPGQQVNLSCIMALYRGNDSAVASGIAQHQSQVYQALQKVHNYYTEAVDAYAKTMGDAHELVLDPPVLIWEPQSLEEAKSFYKELQGAFAAERKRMAALEQQMNALKAEAEQKNSDRKELNKALKPLKSEHSLLQKPLKNYQRQSAEHLKDAAQSLKDWQALLEYFPEGTYRDIEGLCKITDLREVREQDYSLTPGRYVGVSLDIDMHFDYQGRMKEIHKELAELNIEAQALMDSIESLNY